MNEEFIPQQVKQKTDRVSVGVKKEKKEEREGGGVQIWQERA